MDARCIYRHELDAIISTIDPNGNAIHETNDATSYAKDGMG